MRSYFYEPKTKKKFLEVSMLGCFPTLHLGMMKQQTVLLCPEQSDVILSQDGNTCAGPEPSIPAAGSQGPCIHPAHHSGMLTSLPSVCLPISKSTLLMCPFPLPSHPFSLLVPPSTQPGLTQNRPQRMQLVWHQWAAGLVQEGGSCL